MYLSVCLPGEGGIGLRVDYRFDLALHPTGRAVGHFPKEQGGEVPPFLSNVAVQSDRVCAGAPRETRPVSSVDRTRVYTTRLAPLAGNKARVPVPFDPHEARATSCLP